MEWLLSSVSDLDCSTIVKVKIQVDIATQQTNLIHFSAESRLVQKSFFQMSLIYFKDLLRHLKFHNVLWNVTLKTRLKCQVINAKLLTCGILILLEINRTLMPPIFFAKYTKYINKLMILGENMLQNGLNFAVHPWHGWVPTKK